MTVKRKIERKCASNKKKKGTVSSKSTSARTRVKKKAKNKEHASSTDGKVTLPKNLSKESVLRASSLRNELDSYVKYSVLKITYVSAFCFITVGAFLSFASFSFNNEIVTKYQTALITDTDISSYETQNDNLDLISEPKLYFLNEIPAELNTEYLVNFKVENGNVLKVVLINDDHSQVLRLDYFENTAGYGVRIPIVESSGYYTLFIAVESLNGLNTKIYNSDNFYISSEEDKNQDEQIITKIDNIEENEEFNTVDETEEQEEMVEISEERENILDSNENIFLKEEYEAESDLLKTTENFDTESPENASIEKSEFEVPEIYFLPTTEDGNSLSDISVIHVSTSIEVDFIELYARPLNSTTEKFITLGVKNPRDWEFVFDTKNFENGNYELYAKTVLNGNSIKSAARIVTFYNTNEVEIQPINTETERDGNTPVATERQKTAREETVLSNDLTQPEISPKIDKEVEKILETNSKELKRLFSNYNVSLQSEDSSLSETTKQEISDFIQKVSTQSTLDEETKYYSKEIEEFLDDRIKDTQDRIAFFEDLRKQRNRNIEETIKDTDSDGISDFDEINLYKTNPSEPDTDNDGILDGEEIISRHNPQEGDKDIFMDPESPKNTIGLERSDVLMIEDVVATSDDYENESVKANIRGRGLPNSYVTLYIFSSPTIVTIKTDVDGSFEYIFDKELEDGQHDVYVAVTDNRGSIIAQSSPFSFVKQAQAFTPVGVDESEIVTQNTIIETTKNSYTTVFGIAILSLGIILLMLGIGLRTQNEQEFSIVETQKNKKESGV